MAQWGKWVGGALVFALLATTAVFLVARSQGRSAERRAAMAMMEAPAAGEGENAFAAVWLMGYDVPADRVEAIAADDVHRFEAEVAKLEVGGRVGDFASRAAEDFGFLVPEDGRDEAWCRFDEDCLAHVRGHRDRLAGQEARLQAMHGQVAALRGHGFYRNAFPLRIDAPLPAYLGSVPRAALTYGALLYDRGDVEGGLDAVCQVAAAWRPLVANSDSLVVSMVADRVHDNASRLFAGMLAGQGPDTPLPPSCQVAFAAPDVAEGSICEAMKGEYRMASDYIATGAVRGSEPLPWHAAFTLDTEVTRGRMAQYHARACDDAAAERLARDLPFVHAPAPGGFEIECVANVLGCALTSIAAPAYDDYHRRGQDHVMRMRLMATLLWLRSRGPDARPLEARLAVRPAALRSPGRELQVDEDGLALGFQPYSSRAGGTWQVPVSR